MARLILLFGINFKQFPTPESRMIFVLLMKIRDGIVMDRARFITAAMEELNGKKYLISPELFSDVWHLLIHYVVLREM
jgi:hypothetical protein